MCEYFLCGFGFFNFAVFVVCSANCNVYLGSLQSTVLHCMHIWFLLLNLDLVPPSVTYFFIYNSLLT